MTFNNCARAWFTGALALVVALFAMTARADQDEPPEVAAQRLVHVLGYTAGDYGGAVKDGAIVSESEYEEQKALLTDAAKIAATLGDARVTDGVTKVRALIDQKADAAAVVSAVASVKSVVVATYHLSEAPASIPDFAKGKALYAEQCATCHGATGHADTERAGTLHPHPASFHDPKVADPLTPARVQGTIRFGIAGTAMAPLQFIPEADRWSVAFYVMGLRHEGEAAKEAPAYTAPELAMRSDEELVAELKAAGVDEAKIEGVLTDLRTRAPYEERLGKGALALARVKLDRVRAAIDHGDRTIARRELLDAYLDGIEPQEGAINAVDPKITVALERRFLAARAAIDANADAPAVDEDLAGLLAEITSAEAGLAAPAAEKSPLSTAISSGGILLREGVEAALLIAALLGVAAQAGLRDKKRWVHFGWMSALVLGAVTWVASSYLVTLSGASRETLEGVTALLATVVLFYVSYSLLAKKEVARWLKFLRAQVSPRRAAASLFAVAFLAAYREAFETVLFYQAVLGSHAPMGAALAGAAAGAVILLVVVLAYSRAGKFAPPQVFFKVSSWLLYALAVVFAGQGVASLQVTGVLPVHAIAMPSLPSLGLYPTVETCAAQALLLALAALGVILNRPKHAAPSVPAPA